MKTVRMQYKRTAPMLVARFIQEQEIETVEYMAVHAFAHGFATDEHFNFLRRLMNILLVAGQTDKNRKYALEYADKKVKPVLRAIEQRWQKTAKLGVAGKELQTLREFIAFYQEFWKKQTGALYVFCEEQVDAFYKELEEKRRTS